MALAFVAAQPTSILVGVPTAQAARDKVLAATQEARRRMRYCLLKRGRNRSAPRVAALAGSIGPSTLRLRRGLRRAHHGPGGYCRHSGN